MNFDITTFIPNGFENAVSMKHLAAATNLSLRDVRMAIENARNQGAPICSSCDGENGGYYMPTTKQEAERYIRMQEHRIASAKAAVTPVTNILNTLPDEAFNS